MGAQATILGASGYTGGELVRVLTGHPVVRVAAVAAGARAGASLGAVHPALGPAAGDLRLVAARDAAATTADVCFSCLPTGELAPLLDEIAAPIVIDLADGFRGSAEWTYGLTEFARAEVAAATRIANPGCYPTATLLAAVPFARAGLIDGPLVVDALSGTSGAGRRAELGFSLGELHGSAGAYGDVDHRHVPEMERGLGAFGGLDTVVSFTPHLVPMARGVLVTIRAPLKDSIDAPQALTVLRDAYSSEPFVTVTEEWPQTKWAAGSNHVFVSARVDARAGMLIASAGLDNLGKGAAGQAIQNANLALGQDEGCGLDATGLWP
jgi:N-acetyl-gamma-glutamyl-phosphate reductase